MDIVSTARLALPVSARDHIRGNPKAPVTLLEYGDFECPHCGRAHLVIEELRQEGGDLMRLVFRHFPLTQVHPHAEPAAECAEAGGAEHKFWEMHDLLFENQGALDEASLIEYALAAGVDPKLVTMALTEHAYERNVREDFTSGVRSGVNGTPTFFIENLRYDGPQDLVSLLAVIEEVAAEKAR
jgi:protein-disulfide isomerase